MGTIRLRKKALAIVAAFAIVAGAGIALWFSWQADSGEAAAPPRETLSAGGAHTAAIAADGSLWAWGANRNGRLGDGGAEDRWTPTWIMDDMKKQAPIS